VVDLADMLGRFRRNCRNVWLKGFLEVRIEGGDEVVIILLLSWFRKCSPGQIVDVPGVVEGYVREF
jgi:hypothetical protein